MSRKSKALEFLQEGYNITFTGRNVQITDSMKDYAIEKISKIERFSSRIMDVIVTMDIQRYEQRAEIQLKLDHIRIIATATTDDMYASIDKAVAKLESQFHRYKEKIREFQDKPDDESIVDVSVFESLDKENILDINDDIEEENLRRERERFQLHQIVKHETHSLKTLTFNEALMKMELSGDQFLIFRNEENRKLCVIYLREDGNYGIIEAEK
jgi:putative sigma-54 modulation protein